MLSFVPREAKTMKHLFKIQEKIVPELIKKAELRYTILRNIYYNQPIGRRNLANNIDESERQVRNELEFLRSRAWIEITRAGASLTTVGESFLRELDNYIKEIKNISSLEKRLKNFLGLEEILVVPGNLGYESLKKEIGRFTARFLKDIIKGGDILAVTGGSTLAEVAEVMQYYDCCNGELVVVPGRGGLGEDVEIQANTIAAKIAKKLGGKYQLLHIPDNIKEENIDYILNEPSIKRTMNYLKKANILLHGVGSARKMAERRKVSEKKIKELIKKGAIGESFGYYFNRKGEIVHSTTSVGMSLEDLSDIDTVIAVAAGREKAEAIIAAVSPKYQDILITDEEAAREILKLA